METKKIHFLIVDDDKYSVELHASLLEEAGYRVTAFTSSKKALMQIEELKPDCIVSDLLMPELDGMELFYNVRKIKSIKQPAFIILTGKVFEFDRRHALDSGVDGYLNKPVNPKHFVSDLLEIINNTITVQFWGIRGTFPVPGTKTIRYGGNTSCVTLSVAKKHFFIFDAGTGIKELSNYLIRENMLPLSAKLFISHPHYDHINGIPFFAPFYMPGNEFEILGTSYSDMNIEKLISGQMDNVYFPITVKEFSAKINYRTLAEEIFDIGDIHIETLLLNHPGRCLGYRVQYRNKVFCYVTDHELYLQGAPYYNQFDVDRLIHFIREADVLVMDTSYTDAEYLKKIGWGHSCVSRVIDIADKAKVKLFCMFHHDPDQFDNDIDFKLSEANVLLESRHSSTRCIAPSEGERILI